jgi:hypothetical protein
MILSILGSRPRHEDLLSLTNVDGVQVIDLPPSSADRLADFTLICSDGCSVAIHYHSPQSLLSAIRMNVLKPTLISLKAASPWSYLLIGGVMTPNADGKVRLGDKTSGFLWSAIQGALLTAQEIGIPVLTLPHADSVPETLIGLAKRDRGSVKALPMREALFYSPAEQVLMALPGIGEGKAEALLRYCGDSAAHALMALTSEYAGAPGIGPETRRKVRQALGIGDGFALVPTKETDLSLHEKAEIAQTTSSPRRAA